MAVPYNRKQLIQRIRKHLNNGYPNDAFATSDNEIMLYIDQSIGQQIKALAYERAKLNASEGFNVLEVPEAFQITQSLPALQLDDASGYWFTTLPQPPISLPLGYSITRIYTKSPAFGESDFVRLIDAKRWGRRKLLPMPDCILGMIENQTLWLTAANNQTLSPFVFYVQMPINRTSDITQPMNLPDDIIETIFGDVTNWLTRRYQMPKDIVNDDLPEGNNSLKAQIPQAQ